MATAAPTTVWLRAAGAPWLPTGEGVRLRLRGAEVAVEQGHGGWALARLPDVGMLAGDDRARGLAVLVRIGGQGSASARRTLAIEFPSRFRRYLAGQDLSTVTSSFSRAEWAAHAEAWLQAGHARSALAAARRAGSEAALTAARACRRLRRSREALTWAERAGAGDVQALLEGAEARRQLAWNLPSSRRGPEFDRLLTAARRMAGLAEPGTAEAKQAELLMAEALVETGRLAQARQHLVKGWDSSIPRCEWVLRRMVFLSSRAPGALDLSAVTELAATGRLRRLVAFWQGVGEMATGDTTTLIALVSSGMPDLPSQWAARRLGRAEVTVHLAEPPPAAVPPPPWSRDLMDLGRVSDVVVAWRAELESGNGAAAEWLGLVELADLSPIESIPLLIRGEPTLLRGPWSGISRDLLQRYLPLRWRDELEAAARRSGVPPWVLAGLVRQESGWNPSVVSAAGAVGLTQVLPATGREMARALRIPYRSDSVLMDPATNLTLGAALLARWQARFAGSWVAALASYNAGERRIRELWERTGRRDGPEFVEALEIPETWDYVHRVVVLSEGYRLLYWQEGKAYPWM